MKNIIRSKLIIIIALIFASCSKGSSADVDDTIDPTQEQLKKVLIIGIDGCRPDAIVAADTPNLDALMANGTYSLDARNTGVTSSGPAWSSMLTGVWEAKHGVTNNAFTGSNFTQYPHLFNRVEGHTASFGTASVCQWHPINDKIANGNTDVLVNTPDTSVDTRNAAVTELEKEETTALFVHFDDVDHAGHGTGFSPTNSNYIDAIERVDSQIDELMDAIKGRENYADEDWAIIVSTDHGGIGTSHGGNSEEERTIFMIVSGDNIENKEIKKTTTTTTIPPVTNCLDSTTELHFESDGQISIADNAAHSFGAAQDFTLECRVRSEFPTDVQIVGKKDWDSGLFAGYVFSFSGGNFKVNIGDGTNRVDVEAGVITDNEWHMLTATFDRDGDLSVYVDGVLQNSKPMSAIGDIDNAFPLTFGADGLNAYKYRGHLAEVRIYNTILEASDIDVWKCKVLDNTHAKYANLQGHWEITEGTGTTITDSSTNAAHGTLTGASWGDATTDQVIDTHDYTGTPRTVDVVSTALTHLCIPIDESWDLDSNSLIDKNCDN